MTRCRLFGAAVAVLAAGAGCSAEPVAAPVQTVTVTATPEAAAATPAEKPETGTAASAEAPAPEATSVAGGKYGSPSEMRDAVKSLPLKDCMDLGWDAHSTLAMSCVAPKEEVVFLVVCDDPGLCEERATAVQGMGSQVYTGEGLWQVQAQRLETMEALVSDLE